MKVVFMGTPDFAVPCLQKLIDCKHQVAAVFSQPDKPVGRKKILTAPPVKQLAVKYNIPVYQPDSMKNQESIDLVKSFNADAIIVVAYGKILPKEILSASKYGCINVHASLLPKYRGAAPIQWAVLNGDKKTGVTIMQMDEGIDTGDMLLVEETEIGENETSEELFDRLSVLGAELLSVALDRLEAGQLTAVPQPENNYGYAGKITKELSPINWSRPSFEVHNQVRGLQSWPCALTVINGKTFKIHKTALSDLTGNAPGEIVDNNGRLTVCCGDGKCIDILEIQPDGKKRMDIKAFLAGNKLDVGIFIGE